MPGEHGALHLAVSQCGFVMGVLTPSQAKVTTLNFSAGKALPLWDKKQNSIRSEGKYLGIQWPAASDDKMLFNSICKICVCLMLSVRGALIFASHS